MFVDLKNHVKENGWPIFFAVVSAWAVWYTGKWFLTLVSSDSLATKVFTIWIPVALAIYSLMSENKEGNVFKAFWKGWRELSVRTHILITVGCVSLINFFKLGIFLYKKYFLHEPGNLKNIKTIANGKI